MSNPTLTAEIREALLTSMFVDEVVQVRTTPAEGAPDVVGVRVALTNVDDLYSLPPVIAELRQLVREAAGGVEAVFIEPDVTAPQRETVTTEAIVFPSWD
ncbi:hypothetical protein EG850_10650 [Gulosibacter macacae]|uniref:MIP18 family-like domain-containing protein n=1 Tax=Gulosibacter macacae TaxID=2488791 RepID=A0A3P3VT79_9MICO|nr:hypothetical protein [Gulosibacter macacae]RRJ85991.1 hypothetical protein EG850_10650 [Gulosibacter macacae]